MEIIPIKNNHKMGKNRLIHSLDSLEKEIYRLQLEALEKEKKISENMEYLHDNASTILFNTLFRKKRGSEQKMKGNFFKTEKFERIISKFADRLTDRAANGIASFFEQVFSRQKK
jgi:hypothetical protein